MAAMSAMEPHHVNGSLGEWASGDADTLTPVPTPLLREPRAPPGGLLQPVRLCAGRALKAPLLLGAAG